MEDLTQPHADTEVPNETTRTNEAPLAPAHGSAATISVTPTKWSEPREIPCPDCYGGHFRPCNICGDSGVALFSERLEQPNDELRDGGPRTTESK